MVISWSSLSAFNCSGDLTFFFSSFLGFIFDTPFTLFLNHSLTFLTGRPVAAATSLLWPLEGRLVSSQSALRASNCSGVVTFTMVLLVKLALVDLKRCCPNHR